MKRLCICLVAAAMLLSTVTVFANSYIGGSETFYDCVYDGVAITPFQPGNTQGVYPNSVWWVRGTGTGLGIPLRLTVWSNVYADSGFGLGSVRGADGTTHNGGWQPSPQQSRGFNESRGGDYTRTANWNQRSWN